MMTENVQPTGTDLMGFFRDRALAETACARLRDSETSSAPHLGVTGEEDGYVVTVEGVAPGQLTLVRDVLWTAGATTVEEGPLDRARSPRPVQPGFTDASPGIVPEAADFAAEKYEGPGGRFAKQIDAAPEEPRSEKTSR